MQSICVSNRFKCNNNATLKPSKFPRWYSADLRQLIFEKKVVHKRYKENRLWDDYLAFSALRARCKHLTKECYLSFIHNTENSLTNNVKVFWNFLNAKKKR